ncbi:universal stress protein [Seonamhaeicola maritimus]|uniref:Universal stress protein n=2 Tax=Seonamhaeicola maritimus TaxID=2591822 RepID=A0A5C7GIJ2_9FLAO|nr:universal stress protein [Seonamhaeicola maritimus]
MNMKTNNRYKILVLLDLKSNSDTIIKTTANLAKMIGGDIDILHVKKPVDIVKNDNQLSSVRSINRDYISSKNHIEDVVKSIDKGLNVSYGLTYGNVKQEIEEHIKNTNPNIIVLGKKRFNALKLTGDKLTKFILKKYSGVVFMASNKNVLEYDENLSLGILNNFEQPTEDLAKRLIDLTQKPVKAFKIQKSADGLGQSNNDLTSKKTVEYVFESNDNAVGNLSHYMAKSNVDLLCVSRNMVESKKSGILNLNDLIKKVDVSLLLTA